MPMKAIAFDYLQPTRKSGLPPVYILNWLREYRSVRRALITAHTVREAADRVEGLTNDLEGEWDTVTIRDNRTEDLVAVGIHTEIGIDWTIKEVTQP